MLITIGLLSFFTVIFLTIGLYLIITAKKREIASRLKKFTRTPGQVIIDEQVSTKEKFTLKNVLRILGKVFETRSFTKKIEVELLKAISLYGVRSLLSLEY